MAEKMTKEEYDLKDVVLDIKPVEMRDLVPGDHLAVRGNKLFTKYYHHGIFIDHAEGVVDFGTTSMMSPPTIQKIDMTQFTAGRCLLRVNYPTGSCNEPKATIATARELIQDPELWGQYNIKTNNCEHFAMKCKTGKHASEGVVKAMRKNMKRLKLNIAATASTSGFSVRSVFKK